MKDVQCYELFGGIALKNHAFSFMVRWQSNVKLKYSTFCLMGILSLLIVIEWNFTKVLCFRDER